MPNPTTTAEQVFSIAMGLMDEVAENTGETNTSDTKEYRVRTLFILNALRGELYPYSDTYKNTENGTRPIVPGINDFDKVIDLDDYICQSVMPYGLAAHLLLDENPSAASFFQQRYEELVKRLSVGLPAPSESIVDLYGIASFEYNEFSRW